VYVEALPPRRLRFPRCRPRRRLALWIGLSIESGTQWAAHEPNAGPLWRTLREQVSQFMLSLHRQGALQGITPDEAFFVRCDATTTSAADIAAGRVNILVGFAALRAAEFAVLTVRQSARLSN
jgi:uncharacterized protein